jgi:hypothetical protein
MRFLWQMTYNGRMAGVHVEETTIQSRSEKERERERELRQWN